MNLHRLLRGCGERPVKLGGHLDLDHEVLAGRDLGASESGGADVKHAFGMRVAGNDGYGPDGRAFVADEPQVDEQRVRPAREVDWRGRVRTAWRPLADDTGCAVANGEAMHDCLERASDPPDIGRESRELLVPSVRHSAA